MHDVTCTYQGCRCRNILFAVDDYTGVVQTKCFKCRTLHTFSFGGTALPTSEVRCAGTFKGQGTGWCGMLISKISPDSQGTFSYRCPRCGDQRTLRIGNRVLVST